MKILRLNLEEVEGLNRFESQIIFFPFTSFGLKSFDTQWEIRKRALLLIPPSFQLELINHEKPSFTKKQWVIRFSLKETGNQIPFVRSTFHKAWPVCFYLSPIDCYFVYQRIKSMYFMSIRKKGNESVGEGFRKYSGLFLQELAWLLSSCKNVILCPEKEWIQSVAVRFFAYLMEFYPQEHHVGFYAGKLSVSPNYLNRVIKSWTGKTAKENILDLLSESALSLLKDKKLRVSEISELLGFSSPAQFARFFRRQHNISPTGYRIQHKNQL